MKKSNLNKMHKPWPFTIGFNEEKKKKKKPSHTFYICFQNWKIQFLFYKSEKKRFA